jgi:hypothetical protein
MVLVQVAFSRSMVLPTLGTLPSAPGLRSPLHTTSGDFHHLVYRKRTDKNVPFWEAGTALQARLDEFHFHLVQGDALFVDSFSEIDRWVLALSSHRLSPFQHPAVRVSPPEFSPLPQHRENAAPMVSARSGYELRGK